MLHLLFLAQGQPAVLYKVCPLYSQVLNMDMDSAHHLHAKESVPKFLVFQLYLHTGLSKQAQTFMRRKLHLQLPAASPCQACKHCQAQRILPMLVVSTLHCLHTRPLDG